MIALVFRYEVRDPEEFARIYGPDGEWARFFRQGTGFIGTELLHDVLEPERFLVIDRWDSIDAYNAFLVAFRDEYMRRSDEARFYDIQEFHFGTFENVWDDRVRSRRTMTLPAGGAATTPSACTCRCPSRTPERIRGVLPLRRTSPGRPGDRPRRARRGRARRSGRPACDVVRVPSGDGADLRPLPAAGPINTELLIRASSTGARPSPAHRRGDHRRRRSAWPSARRRCCTCRSSTS